MTYQTAHATEDRTEDETEEILPQVLEPALDKLAKFSTQQLVVFNVETTRRVAQARHFTQIATVAGQSDADGGQKQEFRHLF